MNHHVRRRDFARDARVIAAVVELSARDQQLAGGPVLTFLRFQRDATPVEGEEVAKLLRLAISYLLIVDTRGDTGLFCDIYFLRRVRFIRKNITSLLVLLKEVPFTF